MSEATPDPAAAKPAKPAPPPRVLPTQEDVARFIAGEDVPEIENLFNLRALKMYDALYMQIKKAELLPQHWQPLTRHEQPDGDAFDSLAAIKRLRAQYGESETSAARVGQLKQAWLALAGKSPSLWTADDLFVAMRRMLASGDKPEYHEMLSAARDLWRGHKLPLGQEQLELLWVCLDFAREKTKK